MVAEVRIEATALINGKPASGKQGQHHAHGGWLVSAAWLPVSLLVGVICTLLVVSVAGSGPGAWWQDIGGHHSASTFSLLARQGSGGSQVSPLGPAGSGQQPAEGRLQQQLGQQQAAGQQPQAEAPRPQWLGVPWGPLLTREEAARGISYYGSGARLQAVAAKLLAGKPIKAYTLGGSVTRGIGSTHRKYSYAARFFEFINASFPHRDHVFENRGIGGTNSGVYSVCAEYMVDQDADLVVLDFTINDARDAAYTDPERRAYEQLLRKLLALPGRPAVLQLHHYPWWHAVGDGIQDGGLFYFPPGEAQLTVFAQYYDIPALSVRAAMWPLMNARVKGFNPDRQLHGDAGGGLSPTGVFIPAAEQGREKEYWYRDRTHPGDLGHGTLAELLAAAVSQAVLEAAAPRPHFQLVSREEVTVGPDGLPQPMIPGNQAVPTSLCAMEEEFKGIVTAAEGFEYRAAVPDAPSFVEQKWGWTGLEPGAWAELEFDTAAGFQDLASNKTRMAQVSLSYLRSYEGMGMADVECVSGCTCQPSELDGTWDKRLSLQQMLQFWVSRHPRCRVRVTISSRQGEVPQEGHKVTLAAVMVAQWAMNLNRFDEQLEQIKELTQ